MAKKSKTHKYSLLKQALILTWRFFYSLMRMMIYSLCWLVIQYIKVNIWIYKTIAILTFNILKWILNIIMNLGQDVFSFITAQTSFWGLKKDVAHSFSYTATLSEIKRLTPIQFENYVGKLFEREGYTVETTSITGDGGVDLYIQKRHTSGIVQCKKYEKSVPIAIVRELYGVMHHEKSHCAYLVTTGRFTHAAQEFVNDKNIYLIDGEQLTEWIVTGKLK